MTVFRIKSFLWIFLFTGFQYLSAQVQTDTLKKVNLDEIVVTGTKTAVTRDNLPLTISVVSKEKIENSSESALLPVLSQQVPGLFVTERGIGGFGVSTGAAGQITMRGIGGSPNTEVLVLLNGNPQFMGLMGHPLPDAYVASDVEKVEVIRGPASVLYGTNAMGGVINIITKSQQSDGGSLNARVMYGSYNTQKYMVNGGLKKGKLNIFASFNHDQTDGSRDSSDFSINNGYLKMGYVINNHFEVNADFSLANFDATDPGKEGSPAGETIDITRGMGAFSVDNKYDKTNGSVRFFYNFGEHTITDGFHSKDQNFGLVAYQSFNIFKGNTISLGVDAKQYGGMAENTIKKISNGDTTSSEIAEYIYIQQNVTSKFLVNTGFRLEYNDVYGFEPVPTAGAVYKISNNTVVKTSVSKGFRSPTIKELYLVYLWGTPNKDLKPEKMVNYEIGVCHKLANNKLSVELTGFKVKGDNIITLVSGKYQNSGDFSNTGVEFAGNYMPDKNLIFNVNYSYISLKKAVTATPGQQLIISGNYKFKKISLNISVQHIHDLYIQTSPSEIKNSYTLLDARLSYKHSNRWDLFIKGENLTDTKYYINYGYPMPGIVAFAGVNLHL